MVASRWLASRPSRLILREVSLDTLYKGGRLRLGAYLYVFPSSNVLIIQKQNVDCEKQPSQNERVLSTACRWCSSVLPDCYEK